MMVEVPGEQLMRLEGRERPGRNVELNSSWPPRFRPRPRCQSPDMKNLKPFDILFMGSDGFSIGVLKMLIKSPGQSSRTAPTRSMAQADRPPPCRRRWLEQTFGTPSRSSCPHKSTTERE